LSVLPGGVTVVDFKINRAGRYLLTARISSAGVSLAFGGSGRMHPPQELACLQRQRAQSFCTPKRLRIC